MSDCLNPRPEADRSWAAGVAGLAAGGAVGLYVAPKVEETFRPGAAQEREQNDAAQDQAKVVSNSRWENYNNVLSTGSRVESNKAYEAYTEASDHAQTLTEVGHNQQKALIVYEGGVALAGALALAGTAVAVKRIINIARGRSRLS